MLLSIIFVFIALSLLLPNLIFFALKGSWIHSPLSPWEEPAQFADIRGNRLHYRFMGPAAPKTPDTSTDGSADRVENILLIHGMGAHLFCWRFLQPLLSKKYNVWAIDLIGYGQSDSPKGMSYDLENQSLHIIEFIEKMIGAPVVLVGSSLGGVLALESCLRRPGIIKKLVLISPPYDPKIVLLNISPIKYVIGALRWLASPAIVKVIVHSLYGTKVDKSEKTVMAYSRPYLKNPGHSYAILDSFKCVTDKTFINRISKISTPTLILWGDLDHVVPYKFAPALPKIIQNSKFATRLGAGHHIQEEDPQWVKDEIEKFMQLS